MTREKTATLVVALVLAALGCVVPALAAEPEVISAQIESQTLDAGYLENVREINAGEVVQVNPQRDLSVEVDGSQSLQDTNVSVFGLSRSDGFQLVSIFENVGTQERRFQFKGKFLELVENGYVP
ncbi:hypothetical protein [Corynebacterium hindlerae]|uniref:hypothetical protein n=1 Tax=Corynebacterium hindlerae TaxID=699041 RepID=UPI003AAC66C5